MASVAFQLIEEVAACAQRNSLEDAREICTDSTYFPNNLHRWLYSIQNNFLYIQATCFDPSGSHQALTHVLDFEYQ